MERQKRKINKTKNWFFKNINNFDKLLARQTKKKRERGFKLLKLGIREEASLLTLHKKQVL